MRTDPIARLCGAIAGATSAEAIAAAFAQHLGEATAAALPTPAQAAWRDIARLLKSPADRPIPEKALAAIRSWPAARIGELLTHLRNLDEILEALENERLEDEIRDKIRRHYL